MTYKLIFPCLLVLSCGNSEFKAKSPIQHSVEQVHPTSLNPVDSLYAMYQNNPMTSVSHGTVSKGSLENGTPFPFSGKNFHYFDTSSYLQKRGFVHSRVKALVLAAYDTLFAKFPAYRFGIMECSNEHGGPIWPHKTHQNGLSVDFMSPLLSDKRQSETYDYTGTQHYFMEFDENGQYTTDPTHQIDFEMIAQHLLIMHELAANYGLKISKVIFKLNLKDELFATKTGKIIQNKLYFAQNLSNLINNLHDDHYHVDFEPVGTK